MKKLFLLLVAICSLVFTTSAQDSVLNRSKLPKTLYYYDDFVDRRNGWEDYDNSAASAHLKGGIYYYESKRPSNSYYTWNEYNIDQSQNYYIEMEFALASGAIDRGNGILFNHTTTIRQYQHEFLIAANKYFRVCKTVDDNNSDIKSWTTTPYIHELGNNVLGIFAKGNTMYFYINDHLVYSMKKPESVGTGIGFSAAQMTTLAVDKFSIRYNPPPINNLEDSKQGYKKVPLSGNINTPLDESFPVVSADGKMMFFSRSVNMGAIGLDRRTMMYSEYNEATKDWSFAKALPPTINQSDELIQIICVSPDKKTILIDASCDASGRYVHGVEGICMSHKTASGWSTPENIPIQGLINLHHYSTYSLSASNKALIIAVKGKESYGERDLYVSLKTNDKWSVPRNLGPVVNSFGDDYSPCLAPDNVTLYYASTGKPGYGKSDIFMTRRLDETWANWSEPKNLGPDINSALSESWLQVDADGEYAYMNTFSPTKSLDEICKIELPESARPKPVVIVSGKVFNMMTNAPMSATVIYENMDTKTEEGTTVSSAEDGSFVIVLPYGVNYGLTAKATGFLGESKMIDLKVDSLKKGFSQMSADLFAMPLVVDQSIKLNNIFFGADRYDLEDASSSELDRLYEIMKQNLSLKIQVDGHTDKGGTNSNPETLQVLSENRANAVKAYLVGKGIDTDRITTRGFGKTHPVSSNQSLNRRVEIKVVEI